MYLHWKMAWSAPPILITLDLSCVNRTLVTCAECPTYFRNFAPDKTRITCNYRNTTHIKSLTYRQNYRVRCIVLSILNGSMPHLASCQYFCISMVLILPLILCRLLFEPNQREMLPLIAQAVRPKSFSSTWIFQFQMIYRHESNTPSSRWYTKCMINRLTLMFLSVDIFLWQLREVFTGPADEF